MNSTEVERKVAPRSYKTLESETIIFVSTAYAVASLLLVGVLFRFFLSKEAEPTVIGIYAVFSLIFLLFMGVQSRRRTKLNKLPSDDILELCYLVKESSNHGEVGYSGNWHITHKSFNNHAMERIFSRSTSEIIPALDYFSYMLAERCIDVSSVTDKGTRIDENVISIALSESSLSKLKIYESASNW
ncbi:hypothetical protein [Vibrio sp. F13]|uniref:hypothetical protein n=1 Tax=Vibrio sp. F13 TaxID=2070777 RepID=UPI0010BD2228|nr:hypothetical protein [Vibrio sp. F13]TKG00255.1 hypothetical protein FCV76_15925 [Vibrio sp. F13]